MPISKLSNLSLTNGRTYSSFLAGNPAFSPGSYWFATFNSLTEEGYGCASYGDGLFFAGRTNDGVDYDAFTIKTDKNGTVDWQRRYGDGANFDQARAVTVATSGNVYASGSSDTPDTALYVWKYNSSGALQWQRYLNFAGNSDVSQGIVTDLSENVYVTGYQNAGAVTGILTAKYDSSGNLQWQRFISGTTNGGQGYAIDVDSSSNVYIIGYMEGDGLIAKYNSSGTLQWQRKLAGGGTPNNDILTGVAVDSTGLNIYFSGYGIDNAGNRWQALIGKYDSSGNLSWVRYMDADTGSNQSAFAFGCALDSSDNIYIIGYYNNGTDNDDLIAKYNSSGTLQWQRYIRGGSNLTEVGRGIAIDNNDAIIFTGYTTGAGTGNDALFGRLPSDGTKTGTYSLNGQNIIYGASTLTSSSGVWTSSTSTFTESAGTLTSATPTLTDVSAGLTILKTTI